VIYLADALPVVSRTRPALAVVALLVLAGCSTFGGVATTREPFDVGNPPTDGPPTEDGSGDRPPVIAFDPLQDTAPEPFALAEAHEDALLGRSYTVDYTHRETYANGSRRIARNWTTTFGQNRSRFRQYRDATFGNDTVRRQLYANGTHVWATERSNGRRIEAPQLLQTPNGDPLPPSDALLRAAPAALRSGLLAMSVTDVTKLDTTPSGVDAPLFKVEGNETTTPNPFGNETRNASFTLFVTEAGRVVEFTYAYTYERNGEVVHARTRVQYRNVGTATVERPEWVPGATTRAPNTTSHDSTGYTAGPATGAGASFAAAGAESLAASLTTTGSPSRRRARLVEAATAFCTTPV